MNLIKSTSIYSLSSVLNKGIGFLLLPVFTYYLTPKDYGTLSLINTIIAFVTPLIIIEMHGAIAVDYYKSGTSKAFRSYLASALLNPVLSFVFFALVFILFHKQISSWFDLDNSFWVLLIPVFVFLQLMPLISQTLFQVREKPIPYGIFTNSKTIINLVFSLLFVVTFRMNYEGRLLGIVLTGVIFTFIAFAIIKRQGYWGGKINRKFQKDALLFGLPLIPHAVGAIVINMSDRMFIAKMVSVEELGIYSIGYTIGSIIMIIQDGFTKAWTPFFFKKLKENTNESKKQIVLFSYSFMFLLVLCVIGLTLITPLIFKYFINKDYSGGTIYVFWVALGYAFLGFYKIFTGYFFFNKNTKVLGYISFINVALNLTLNYFLINEFGALGAAYATAISFCVFFLIVAVIAIRKYPMPWLFFIKSST